MKQLKIYTPLILVFIVAVVIRFFNYAHLPFTHDELSALSRLEFKNIFEVIEKGIKPDGHPALVQIFLYYWTAIVGTSEQWVKLPFIVFGLLSIFILYLIAKKYFGNTSAIFAALFMACTQYFIIYSQYARPYIVGCFFSLLLLYSLFEILFSQKPKKIQWILFSFSMLFCALDHHICALFATLTAISGLFFLHRKLVFSYLVSCLVSFVLYLPHLKITLAQLSIGGLTDWLSPPANDFLFNYLFFIFHYSFLVLLVVLLIILLARFYGKEENKFPQKNRIRFLLISLFTLTWLVTHLYSVFKAPVIQFSVLIFAAPCFILFIFSFMRELKQILLYFFMSVMVVVLLFSLIYNRKFFQLNYKQGWEEIVVTSNYLKKTYPSKKIVAIVKSEKYFIDFYKRKYNINCNFILQPNDHSFSSSELKFILDSLNTDIILVGNLNPQQNAQIINYFPEKILQAGGYSFEIFCYSKTKDIKTVTSATNSMIKQGNSFVSDFSSVQKGFSINRQKVYEQKVLNVDSLDEYPIGYTCNYHDFAQTEGSSLLVKAELISKDSSALKGLICFVIKKAGKNLFFTASEIEGYIKKGEKSTTAFASMFVGLSVEDMKDEELNVFIWNNSKKNFTVKSFTLFSINENPYKYSLLQKIE